jgi:hypothetical protein
VRDAIGRRVPWGSSANLAAPRDPLIGQRALPLHTARMLGKKLFHRKRAHANTGRFNDREMSGPIGPFNDPSGKSGADLRYGRHW